MGTSEELPDLWVTERCCREDLGEDATASLADLASKHDAVDAFANHSFRPIVHDATSLREEALVEVINRGEAVVWVDDHRSVVWLLEVPPIPVDEAWERRWEARGWEQLLPTARDDAALARHRGRVIAPPLMAAISAGLEAALMEPGHEHGVSLPDGSSLGLLVQHDAPAGMAALWVAIEHRDTRVSTHIRLRGLLKASLPDVGGSWQCDPANRLPHRDLDDTEVALHFHCEGSWEHV